MKHWMLYRLDEAGHVLSKRTWQRMPADVWLYRAMHEEREEREERKEPLEHWTYYHIITGHAMARRMYFALPNYIWKVFQFIISKEMK